MGASNWLLNRSQSGGLSITVRANDPVFLDSEITKYEKKGYERVGGPYTGKEGGVYGRTVYYQSMRIRPEFQEQAQANIEQNKNYAWIFIFIILCIAFPPLLLILVGALAWGWVKSKKTESKDINSHGKRASSKSSRKRKG